ncbi:MAG TPA: SDR family NAD(P)-dependent oxidoreductase [Chloroflexota bacterium]|nr:SDR family NAD(P)-dependent oxidoreductase [Chloroflexota bacterium]
MRRLDEKVAVVTGAGQGIGRGIAFAFAKEGAKVVVADRVDASVHAVVDELKSIDCPALGVVCDVGNEDQVRWMVDQAGQEFGRIDVLVNNAQAWGPSHGRETSIPLTPLEELSEDVWDNTFQTGVKATFYCSKAVFPYLKERGGKIINFGSYWGMIGKEGSAAYNANKEAIRALTRTAAREWGQYGINVNVLSPAAETAALRAWAKNRPEEYQERLKSIPMRRYGDPETDIGRVAVFLASEDSNFITGCTITVDGGLFMCP